MEAEGGWPEAWLAGAREEAEKERGARLAAKAPYVLVRDATARVERLEKRERKLKAAVETKEQELKQANDDLSQMLASLVTARADLATAQRKEAEATGGHGCQYRHGRWFRIHDAGAGGRPACAARFTARL